MTITGPDLQPLAKATALGQALSAAGHGFVHWKSNSHLAQALAGLTDIDMFADPARQGALRETLRVEDCLQIVSRPWASYPDVEDWLAFDEASGRFLHLHLHFALVTGLRRVKHLRLPWGDQLLANTSHALDAAWPTPTPEMELLILLVRMWAKMPLWRRAFAPRLPAHVRRELDWLLGRCNAGTLQGLAAQLLPGIAPDEIAGLVRQPPPADTEVLALSRRIYRALGTAQRMAWPVALVTAAKLNLEAYTSKQLRKLRPQTVTGKTVLGKGLVVSFIGSDGSGKSTVTREIRKWLRYKLDVHGYYMGSGQGSTRLADRLRHGFKPTSSKVKTKSGAGKPRRKPGFIGKLLSLHHLVAIRAKVRALRQAHRLAANGSIAVLDRFPQSQVFGIYDGPRLQDGQSFAWAARAELAAFDAAEALSPDLVVKLSIPPEVGHARKPDHNAETIRRKAEITGLLRFPHARVVVIDAAQPLDQVLLAAKRAVWQALRGTAEGEGHAKPTP
ncbi:hypothetical protein [Aestuariivirga sp.]|uniref:hypothetical protein n=1 Tax=Aestuariivirga sp. TaxID=2650926 RepID=UPI003BAD57C8